METSAIKIYFFSAPFPNKLSQLKKQWWDPTWWRKLYLPPLSHYLRAGGRDQVSQHPVRSRIRSWDVVRVGTSLRVAGCVPASLSSNLIPMTIVLACLKKLSHLKNRDTCVNCLRTHCTHSLSCQPGCDPIKYFSQWLGNVTNVTRVKQGKLVKYPLKVHLLDWKCHYFPRGGRGLERTTLSLCHYWPRGGRGQG